MIKKTMSLLLCLCMIATFTAVYAQPSEWAKDEVTGAIQQGLVPSILQKDYQQNITRKEFCKLAIALYSKLTSLPEVSGSTPFTDVDDNDITLAAQLGIVNGVGEGLFAPDAAVTRQEMCTMLTRAVTGGMKTKTVAENYACEYPDADAIADWAKQSVGFMSVHGAIFGDESGNIMPLGNTTREQAMLFCTRLYNVLYTQSINDFAQQFFSSNGGAPANVQFGSFVIRGQGAGIYYRTPSGVILVKGNGEKTNVLNEDVKMMSADEKYLYYIKNADSKIYRKAPAGEESVVFDEAAKAFALSGRGLYIVTANGTLKQINEIPGEAAKIADNADFPTILGNKVYFGTDGITVIENGTAKKLYEGEIGALTVTGEGIFFINNEGKACSLNADGTAKVLWNKAVKQILPTKTALIVLGRDGAIYRVDFSGRGAARLYDGDYTDINVEEYEVYARNAAGEIFNFSIDAVKNAKIEL